jgi:HEAT repeat protein
MDSARRIIRQGWCISGFVWLAAALGLSSGCVSSLRGTLPEREQHSFRGAAMDFLKRSAFSNEPVLRMQAIEAFQEVAPREGLQYIEGNIENGYAGVSFAALMAVGTLREESVMDRIRTCSEDSDPSVKIAALYGLHRLGEQKRTGELSELLLKHRDARVRANAALAIGRLKVPGSARVLHMALKREQKDAVKMQILEALALLGDNDGIERLRFYGYSAVPDQSALALMLLANAGASEAEELFRYRLDFADQPEIKLQAARGLGKLGHEDGLDLSLAYLFFKSPDRRRKNDPPEQQIARIRALAALALEAIGSPQALGALQRAFEQDGQPDLVRLAIARAAIAIIDRGSHAAG